jgi:hypothetical protein
VSRARRQLAGNSPDSVHGFTLLELLIAIGIFVFLGTAIVYLMRQGLTIFAVGTTDSALQDRADTVLPLVKKDLMRLYAGDRFDPPPPPPDPKDSISNPKPVVPPPPVDVRVRAGFLTLDFPATDLRYGTACPYFAFVVSNAAEWRDPRLRREPAPGADAKDYVPAEVDGAKEDVVYKPSGGLMEVCYVAAPLDPRFPGILTLLRGFRAPIGGADTLLDPKNLSRLEHLLKRCRRVEEGLLYFGATWRNAFATTWEAGPGGGVTETDPVVQALWDSTRALEPTFRLHRGAASLGDPSDDRFPSAVRLEAVLALPTSAGFGRGETELAAAIDATAQKIQVADLAPVLVPRGRLDATEGWIKVGTEWMRWFTTGSNPDLKTREISVERGGRGTKAVAHARGDMVYVGLPSRQDLRLRVTRDAYAKREGGRRASR